MSFSTAAVTPAPRPEQIAAAIENRDLLLSVIDGVTSLLDGVLTILGITIPTTFTVIGTSTVFNSSSIADPTTSLSQTTTNSRPNDSSSSSNDDTLTSTVPTSLPTTTTTTTTAEPTSTSTSTTTTPEPTSTRTTEQTSSTPTRTRSSSSTTVFTTSSSLSFSVSGTQTFTEVVIVTVPAGVPATPAANGNNSSSNAGTIGGVVGGVVGGLLLLAFLIAALFTYKRRKDRTGHGWFLCFGKRPGRHGSDDGWPTFDPTANTSAGGSTHRDPFNHTTGGAATLPDVTDDDLEQPDMAEYNRDGGSSAYNQYAAGTAVVGGSAGAAAANAYYIRSPTQQSFYPQSSHNSHGASLAGAGAGAGAAGAGAAGAGGALGMYPDDAAAQQAYAHNAGRAVSPGPAAAGMSSHSHGAESYGNDYSHLDPPEVRAEREREAAAAAAAAAGGSSQPQTGYGAGFIPHSRKSSQASAGNVFGLSPYMPSSAQLGGRGPLPQPPTGVSPGGSPPPPSYQPELSSTAANLPEGNAKAAAGGGIPYRLSTPPPNRLSAVADEDGLDVAATERAVPGAPGANRLQLSNPDDATTQGHI